MQYISILGMKRRAARSGIVESLGKKFAFLRSKDEQN